MAKPTKRGLGRGLSSLMGSYDSEQSRTTAEATERAPKPRIQEPQPEPKKPEAAKPEPVKQEQAKQEPAKPEKPLIIESAIKPEVVEAPVVKETEKPTSEETLIAKNDGVTIMGVVERQSKPAEKASDESSVAKPAPAEPERREEKSKLNTVTERPADEVDIAKVEPNPAQPRTNFKADELEELTASIKKDGLLQPILVRTIGDRYQIIAGERRWQAAKDAGLTTIPIRVIEADDDKAIELALIENLQRSDLNPIEEAYGYRRMMERGRRTQAEVAAAVSKGRSTIANALRLLELPEEAQQLLYEEEITAGHARAILSIPTDEGRKKLIDRLVEARKEAKREGKKDGGMSVREAENLARLLSGRQKSTTLKTRVPVPSFYKTAARSLSDTFGTKVRVRSSNGKNKIEIEFKDESELKRIYALINQEHAE